MFQFLKAFPISKYALFRALLLIALLIFLSAGQTIPSQAAPTSNGMIAYTDATQTTIHLINPDGSNDHVIYTVPDTKNDHIDELAWSPDNSQIGFISNQESVTSYYSEDVYSIHPNGTGFRRITNPPSVTQLSSFPKGTVTLDVQVYSGTPGPIFIYVAGAPAAQSLVPGAGGTFHFTFDNVADFGNHHQPVVAMFGYDRWFEAGIVPDVIPNQTVYAGTLYLGSSVDMSVRHLSWRADGSAVGFILGNCSQLRNISTSADPGNFGNVILNPNVAGFTCNMHYAPTPALADQILYYEYDVFESHIYRATEGQAGNGTLVYTFPTNGALTALRWLPDGSGFAYSQEDALGENSNLYLVKFGNPTPTQLTNYTAQYTGKFSFSPDGKSIVYELGPDLTSPAALWMLDVGTLQTHQLASQGARPTWGSFNQVSFNHFIRLPLVIH